MSSSGQLISLQDSSTPPNQQSGDSQNGHSGFLSDNSDIPIVAVMGPTGAGKSAFIKIITGAENIRIGDTLTSCTQDLQVVQCHSPSWGRDIRFLDTPGFDDTYKTDAHILAQIADWLRETYEAGVKLSGILYLHRITDNRMTNTLLRNQEMFQNLCGSSALSNVMLVTTHWDQLETTDQGIKNEEELRSNYWQPLLDGGSQMLRFEHTCSSAWNIISSLPMTRKPLEIQREMVDEKKPLSETLAARSMFSWFHRVTKNLEQLIRRIKEIALSPGITDAEKRRLESERARVHTNLKDIEEQHSLIFQRSSRMASDRPCNESSSLGDSNSPASSSHSLIRKISVKQESRIRRLFPRKSRRATETDARITEPKSHKPIRALSDGAVHDIPSMNSFSQAATGVVNTGRPVSSTIKAANGGARSKELLAPGSLPQDLDMSTSPLHSSPTSSTRALGVAQALSERSSAIKTLTVSIQEPSNTAQHPPPTTLDLIPSQDSPTSISSSLTSTRTVQVPALIDTSALSHNPRPDFPVEPSITLPSKDRDTRIHDPDHLHLPHLKELLRALPSKISSKSLNQNAFVIKSDEDAQVMVDYLTEVLRNTDILSKDGKRILNMLCSITKCSAPGGRGLC
ncbi:hypothetical protein P691DRAFT_843395 [Macrolepiota fuliginosa MF-IS2]|uniref:G domain-containing protein n=1 Tax=Macrolepiota fuliginosa MF-IS2 TaxID=1400762 RepID=A0A9P5XJU3_9AGAR|nr:hypothetical protein P691DRAFT_843395 [Macrolepiota fuliginosa MF-IS2]